MFSRISERNFGTDGFERIDFVVLEVASLEVVFVRGRRKVKRNSGVIFGGFRPLSVAPLGAEQSIDEHWCLSLPFYVFATLPDVFCDLAATDRYYTPQPQPPSQTSSNHHPEPTPCAENTTAAPGSTDSNPHTSSTQIPSHSHSAY